LNDIKFIWNPNDFKWHEQFKQLTDLKNIGDDLHSNYPNIAKWCTKQRSAYKNQTLTKDKIVLLNKINFDWDPDLTKWQTNYQKLKDIYLQKGNSNVPIKNGSLGSWCSTQRKTYKKGKLTQLKIDLLESIKFKWEV